MILLHRWPFDIFSLANGAPHPPPSAYAANLTGHVAHRNVAGRVGHNAAGIAKAAFAQAIVDVDAM